jgi:glycosyltransferase involved in cell wall biosynthesis
MVLYAGTLGRMNGVEWLARVARTTVEIDPEVRFVVVGAGSEADKVQREAESVGVLNRNFLMFPALAKNEMPAVLSAATVCTSLFLDIEAMWHNSANKFFDALAAARPVALNYGGWQAELVRERGAGVLLPPGDEAGAAQLLAASVRDTEWLASAGGAAGEMAVDLFCRDDLAARLNECLVGAVDDRG